MSDWELVTDSTAMKKSQMPTSDWEILPNEPSSRQPQNESFGQAFLKAPYRVGEDLYNGAAGFIRNIPGYYQQAQSEVPGVFSSIKQHPGRSAAQLGAGITELGHNTLNFPRAASEYAANRLNLIPKNWAEQVPYQQDISQDINALFGKPEYAGEKLIRGAGRNALNLMGGAGLAKTLNPLKLRAKNIAKDILNTESQQVKSHTKRYNNIWDEAEKSGFNQVPIESNSRDYYHGEYTPEELGLPRIEDFKGHPDSEFGSGHWMTPDLEVAKAYGPNIDKVTGDYNIFDVNKSTDPHLLDLYEKVKSSDWTKKSGHPTSMDISRHKENVDKFINDVKEKGYHGIERNEWESGSPEIMFFEKPKSIPSTKDKLHNDLSIIERYKTPREYQSLTDFLKTPTLQNAQKAQSDMGQIHRKLEEKSRSSSLTSEEKALYHAALESEKLIENNMFKNHKGETNHKLQDEYKKLTKSYRQNVVPYKYNRDIQAFKAQEMLPNELVNKLSRGEFAAKKGSEHRAIGIRNNLTPLTLGGTLGVGIPWLYKQMFGDQQPEK